ncbi:unnamed protein product [Parnassius apollo]|uniref:(apollo) hypothetical protein n=1 Tax=Parnassius apollo TaxID=110799 RepID=A0A8S3YBT3_PARAO|nr:unnamed protein product [Parnassius apollo]
MAFTGTNVSLSQPDITQKLTERIDDLKQRIAAWGKRIRRYTERSTRFNQNRLFQSDQKRLYKSLERPMVSGTGPAPNQADTVAFWRGLWSEPVNHSEGPWTEVVASQCAGITPMDPVTITPDNVAEAVRKAPNWKSPGLNGLHHYWLNGFMVCHAVLARQFQEALNQKSLSSLFTTGITHLVPKDQVPDDSDSDGDTEKTLLLVKRDRNSSVSPIWKPDLDIWGPDPSGMCGLKPEYLESLGITPPIEKWVHVSNFRCDKSELKEVLELAGHVVICTVISATNKYAKVMYNHPLEAVQAVSMLNGQIFYGQVLKVSMYKCPNNEMILPKGLVNIGPGMGERGKPLRDIVKQYERHLNGKISSVNQSIFKDIRDNTINLRYTSNSENTDSIMTINTDLNSNSLEKEMDSNKSHNTNNEVNISQFVPSDQTGENKQTIIRPENNCTQQFQPQYPVSAGSKSASVHSVGGNWASNNHITNPQRNTANISVLAGPRNVYPQFNIPGLNPSQNSSTPRFAGPSSMNLPVNKPLTRFSGPTPRPSCTILRPNGPQFNSLNSIQNSAAIGPYVLPGVRGLGPRPNVCQTGSNSWGNSAPSLNNPVCRPSNLSNVPPTQMPIAEANRPICAPQQQYNGTTSSTVELSNLPLSTTFPLLSEKLAQVGQVLSLELTTTGCAVVRFASPAHAERCYQHFNKMCVMGNYIEVKFI